LFRGKEERCKIRDNYEGKKKANNSIKIRKWNMKQKFRMIKIILWEIEE